MLSRRGFLWTLPAALGLSGAWWFWQREKPTVPAPHPSPPPPPPDPSTSWPGAESPPEVHPITEAEAAFVEGLPMPGPVHPTRPWVALPAPEGQPGTNMEMWDLDSGAMVRALSSKDRGDEQRAVAGAQRQIFALDGRAILGTFELPDEWFMGGVSLQGNGAWQGPDSNWNGIAPNHALYPFFLPGRDQPLVACGLSLMDPLSGAEAPESLPTWATGCQCISADGRWAAGLSGGWVEVWDVQAGLSRANREFPGACDRLSMSPSGAWVAWIESRGIGPCEVVIWHWNSDEVVRRPLPVGFKVHLGSVAIQNPDRVWASWVDEEEGAPNKGAYTSLHACEWPGGRIRSLGWHDLPPQIVIPPMPGPIVVRCGAGTYRRYEADGTLSRIVTDYLPFTGHLAWCGDADHLLVVRSGWMTWIWDRHGKMKVVTGDMGDSDDLMEPPIQDARLGGRAVAWRADGLMAVGVDDGRLAILRKSDFVDFELHPKGDLSKPSPAVKWFGKGSATIRSVAFLGKQDQVALIRADGSAEIWGLQAGKQLQALEGHARANAIAASPDGSRLYTGGHDGVRVWDPVSGKQLLYLDTETHWVCGLAVSPDGGTLVASLIHGRLRAWNLADGTALWTAVAHDGWAAGVAIHPNQPWIASGGEDARVALWDLRTGAKLKETKAHGHSLAWSPDGAWLAASGLDRVRVLKPDLSYEDMAANRLDLDWADEYT